MKMVDESSDFWADHDESCHGAMDSFEDDPAYEDGFMWECCEKGIGEEGCERTNHVIKPGTIR